MVTLNNKKINNPIRKMNEGIEQTLHQMER